MDQLIAAPAPPLQQVQMVRAPCGAMPSTPLVQCPRNVTPPPARAAVMRAASCERGGNDLKTRNATPPPYLSGSIKAPVTSWPGATVVEGGSPELAELRRQLQQLRQAIDCDVLEAFRRMRQQQGDLAAKVDFIIRSHPAGEGEGSASGSPAVQAAAAAASAAKAALAQGVSEHRFQVLDARVAELAADSRGLGDACQADRRRLERLDLLVADLCHNAAALTPSGSSATQPDGRALASESRPPLEAVFREHRRDIESRFANVESRISDLTATLDKRTLPESQLDGSRAESLRVAVGNGTETRKSRMGPRASATGAASAGVKHAGGAADRIRLVEEKAAADSHDLVTGERQSQDKLRQDRDAHEKSERAPRASAVQVRRSVSTGAISHPARSSLPDGSSRTASIPRGGSESPPRGPSGAHEKRDRPVSFGFDDLARSAEGDGGSSPIKTRSRRQTPWQAPALGADESDDSPDDGAAADSAAEEPSATDACAALPCPDAATPSRLRQPRGSAAGGAKRPSSIGVRCCSSDAMGSTGSTTHLNALS